MLVRDGYRHGVPCWVDTLQPDPVAAADFYAGLFGWDFEDRTPDGPSRYFVARLHGYDVAGVGSPRATAPPAWNTYVWVDNADDAAATARNAGGAVLVEPFDVADDGRMAVLADPTGAVINVWQAKKHRGAQLVNVSNTWNWSDLNSRDPDAVKAFYGVVFGWRASTMDFGEASGVMWRVPGYGDLLAQLDPGLRERHAAPGVPEGFSDAVAWLQPMNDAQFPADVPSHWSVTFSVDDSDVIAARAAELGGRVIAPPFDAGPVRIAVLADPQGAVFTVSRYQPD